MSRKDKIRFLSGLTFLIFNLVTNLPQGKKKEYVKKMIQIRHERETFNLPYNYVYLASSRECMRTEM